MEGNNDKKFSGKNIITTVIIIVLAVVLCISLFFYTITNGIIGMVGNWIKGAVETATDSGSFTKIKDWLGLTTVKNGMNYYLISDEAVQTLKDQIESQSINTEISGLTQVRLKKILMAHIVSTSFDSTLVLVPVSENDIVNNVKERSYGIEEADKTTIDNMQTVNDFVDYSKSKGWKKDSKDVWTLKDPNFDLYYESNSNVFFYFKDTSGFFDSSKTNQWYLGAVGATKIVSEGGEDLEYKDAIGFAQMKASFESNPQAYGEDSALSNQILRSYTTEGNIIKVYNIVVDHKEYEYSFKNKNIPDIHFSAADENNVYSLEENSFNLEDVVSTTAYQIPIELMLNMLDITGSSEFVEEFIDYALERIEVKVKACSIIEEDHTYDKEEYNIDSNFIAELYEMLQVSAFGDSGNDNFKAYKGIIYDRKYNGSSFNHVVTKLSGFEDIDYGELTDENGDKIYDVGKLKEYVKSAYDPPVGFDLGPISVTEGIETIHKVNNWQFYQSEIDTWYGDFQYSTPEKETEYSISTSSAEATQEEYDGFNFDSMNEFDNKADETITRVYINKTLSNQVGGLTANGNELYIVQGGSDIYDDALQTDVGKADKSHYWNWTVKGLINIGMKDNGTYNENPGVFDGSDYIYSKYKKINTKTYKTESKLLKEVLNTSNVTQTNSNIDEKLKQFLSLLKNEDGQKPAVPSASLFKQDGKVVGYGDIYDGDVPVGDMLFKNGALMLFNLLESSENTQNLVNVFKYLAYLYSGQDYGITSADQIAFLFSTNQYAGADFIVNTAMSDKNIVLTKQKLKEAIEKTYSGQTKTNLLSALDGFINIQESKKVNSVFAVAVCIHESSGGTNWDLIDPSTYNWISIKGSYGGGYVDRKGTSWNRYSSFNDAVIHFGNLISGSNYFGAGKYTVTAIAPTYCDESWGTAVVSEMTKIFSSIGISVNTGGIEGESDGITTLTVGDKTYKNFKQINPAYKSITLANYPNSTLYNSGCAVTSVSIICSAYDPSITPVVVNNYEASIGSTYHPGVVQHYTGIPCSWVDKTGIRNDVVNQLKRGYPTIVFITSNNRRWATSRQHFFVILSISDDGQSVYVSDPASNSPSRTGWIPVSALDDSAFTRYMKMGG